MTTHTASNNNCSSSSSPNIVKSHSTAEQQSLTRPIGIYWDIQNCQIPVNRNPLHIVQRIREKLYKFGGKEAEFVCVCDVQKEKSFIIDRLNAAQVTVVHVAAIAKNAADEKLKSYLRKFSNTYTSPGCIALITSDINFAPELYDLRYRCGFHIVLLHRVQISEALAILAHERFVWDLEILGRAPSMMLTYKNTSRILPIDIRVDNLDVAMSVRMLKQNLYSVFSAIVRVLHVTIVPQSLGGWFALVQVPSKKDALEAVHRLHKTKLGQATISVSLPPPSAVTNNNNNLNFVDQLRQETIELFKGAPSQSLPLNTVIEMLKKRLKRHIDISDLRSLSELVIPPYNANRPLTCRLNNDNLQRSTPNNLNGTNPSDYCSNRLDDGNVNNTRQSSLSVDDQQSNVKHFLNNSSVAIFENSNFKSISMNNETQGIMSNYFGHKRTYSSSIIRRRSSKFCYCSTPVIHPSASEKAFTSPKLLCCMFRDQLVTLLSQQRNQSMPVSELPNRYKELFNRNLCLQDFGYSNLAEMLDDMEGIVQRYDSPNKIGAGYSMMIKLRDTLHYQATVEEILHIFLYRPDKELTMREFQNEFRDTFGFELPLKTLTCSLTDILEVFEGRNRILGVRLTPIQRFALRVRRLLLNTDSDLLLSDLERAYRCEYGEKIKHETYGFSSIIGLLRAASHVLYLKGRGNTLTVCINRNFLGFEMKKRTSVDDSNPETPPVRPSSARSITFPGAAVVSKISTVIDEPIRLHPTSTPLTKQIETNLLTADSDLTDESEDGNLSSVASSNDKSYVLEPVSNFLFNVDESDHKSERLPLLFANDDDDDDEAAAAAEDDDDDASSYYFETESDEKDVVGSKIVDENVVDDCRRQRSSAMLLASIFSSSGGSLSSTLSGASILDDENRRPAADSMSSSSQASNNCSDLASLTTVDQLSQGGGVESSPSPPPKVQNSISFMPQRKSRLAAKFSGLAQ